MKGFILINAYYETEEYLYQAKRLRAEFAAKNVEIDIIRGDSFLLYIENSNIVSRVSDYDFCIFMDKDKYLLTMLDKIGMPIFNSCEAILTCDDKMLTYIALADQGIAMPVTLGGPLCFRPEGEIKEQTLKHIETLGYPLIIKESYGSLGKGVYLARDRAELSRAMEVVKCKPYLAQEYVRSSYGKDVRIIVIGGQVVGGMLRESKNDFRSNIGGGGDGRPYYLTDEMRSLAVRVSTILGLDYCGLDVLFGESGPVICEVNSNAFFYAFEKVTQINVAAKYADYILSKMKDRP